MRIALAVLAGLCCVTPAAAQERRDPDRTPIRTTPFRDVPKEHWAYDAVEQMRKLGILRGYPPQPAPKRVAPAPAKVRRAHR